MTGHVYSSHALSAIRQPDHHVESGKVAWYDFDSEQYRSPIRKNMIKVQGVRGELINDELYYLDDKNEGQYHKIVTNVNVTHTKDTNPNLSSVR